jgi:hypothetical protein
MWLALWNAAQAAPSMAATPIFLPIMSLAVLIGLSAIDTIEAVAQLVILKVKLL